MTKGEAEACRAVANRLSTLVDAGRDLRGEAKAIGLTATARNLSAIIGTLDGARTRLVEDGPEYLDAARAFIDAGAGMLADRAAYIGRVVNGR